MMKNIRATLINLKFPEYLMPLAFLVIAILGFGLLANRLGYYQDDWPYIFYAFNKGIPSLTIEMYYDSRPNAAWMYISLFKLLGFNPLAWHITALLTRWLTATTLWYFLKRVFPQNKREVTFAVLLFLIHPFFLIQPYAVNSMLYWGGFFFFAVSLYLMARTITETTYRIPLITLAVFLEGLHLFTSEYYVGMVLIRPLILFWLFDQTTTVRERITKTILNWLPYLTALAAYVIWRMFLYVPPPIGDRNAPKILYALFQSPIETIGYLIRTALQDSLIVTFTSWYRILVPELLSFASVFNWFVLFITGLSFLAAAFFLTKTFSTPSTQSKRWLASPLTLGLLLVFLGLAPLWIIGQDIVTHKNQFAGSRFGIGSTLGAALILAVILENLLDDVKKKIAVVSVCIALAVSMHLTNAKDFSYSWEKQERLARELLWRAPSLEPGTAIVTDEEILGYMGSYSVSYSLITTYQSGDIDSPPYWYFPFYYTNPNVNDYFSGTPLEGSKLTMDFKGNSQKMILLSFNPEMQRCLWILQPQDTNLRLVNDDMQRLAAGSDIQLIKKTDVEPAPPKDIYGETNTQTWCYYFEKADLARQYAQWEEIVRLWEEAQAVGERPDNGFEYIPFIEGWGHTGNWEQVKETTKFAKRISAGLEPSLCSAMDRLTESAPASQEKDETIKNLKEDLDCSSFQ
ncbi:MAG TPA: hypothetical protein PK078_11950 [Anaerolineales bacterium]|nr:hypothetical protein [Anaerolineales bacterium]